MNKLLEKMPNNKRVIEFASSLNKEIMSKLHKMHQEEKSFTKLCRDGTAKAPNILAQLKCRYESNNVAFLKIAPIKVEEANLDPNIVIFHDVIYDREIEEIKQMAKPLVSDNERSSWTFECF